MLGSFTTYSHICAVYKGKFVILFVVIEVVPRAEWFGYFLLWI